MINLSTLAIVLIFYFARIFILCLLIFFGRFEWGDKFSRMKNFRKFFDKTLRILIKSLLFSEILLICIEGYLELLLAGFLNIRGNLVTTDGEIMGVVIGYLSLFLVLVFLPSVIF